MTKAVSVEGTVFLTVFRPYYFEGSRNVPNAFAKPKMARFAHYSPQIRRELVRVLFYERKRRGIPMTRLVDEILSDALQGTQSWHMMEEPAAYNQPSVQEES